MCGTSLKDETKAQKGDDTLEVGLFEDSTEDSTRCTFQPIKTSATLGAKRVCAWPQGC
jgi:hypothetical protein